MGVAEHMTPANISMGVSGTLAIAGCLHALLGPTLRLQAEQMSMPAWFILCAGLLMLCSAAAYLVKLLAIKLIAARAHTEKKKENSHKEATSADKSKENLKPSRLSTSCGKITNPAKEAGAWRRTASLAPARKPADASSHGS